MAEHEHGRTNSKPHREDVCPGKKGTLDLDDGRAPASPETKGPEYWRSLEELAGSAEFQEMLHREFPKGASEWLDSVSRRGFLKLMGASLAMAGMTACTKQPLEADCSLRKAARRSNPRPAIVFRHRVHVGRIRQPGAGGEPSVPSHQD